MKKIMYTLCSKSCTMTAVIIVLDQLRNGIRYAESAAIEQLLMK